MIRIREKGEDREKVTTFFLSKQSDAIYLMADDGESDWNVLYFKEGEMIKLCDSLPQDFCLKTDNECGVVLVRRWNDGRGIL